MIYKILFLIFNLLDIIPAFTNKFNYKILFMWISGVSGLLAMFLDPTLYNVYFPVNSILLVIELVQYFHYMHVNSAPEIIFILPIILMFSIARIYVARKLKFFSYFILYFFFIFIFITKIKRK